ncbi:MAG: hypothetical protein BWK73_16940 [Thiothrix lacustris]|uniref:Lipoprotein n=1 Tax=Thiothrix lacustris TaxID=525917 RepID=A0A1Y1QQX5_9GAMM|nr:MAG: hypothetical protein BWK73_16940 [Thiothrix lacustris]
MDNKQCQSIKRVTGLLMLSLSTLAGCSSLDNMRNLNNNTTNTALSAGEIADYAANQEAVYQALLSLAGLPGQPATTDEWGQVIMAGVQYSNQKCENYLEAVDWAKQGRQRDSNLLGQVGTFTNGVMGITDASARDLALTAAAFGSTSVGFNTLNQDSLAGLEASAVRSVVHTAQQQYVKDLDFNQYTNRISAFNALQGYIRLCMPGNIAAEANQAVRNTKTIDSTNADVISSEALTVPAIPFGSPQ